LLSFEWIEAESASSFELLPQPTRQPGRRGLSHETPPKLVYGVRDDYSVAAVRTGADGFGKHAINNATSLPEDLLKKCQICCEIIGIIPEHAEHRHSRCGLVCLWVASEVESVRERSRDARNQPI
jgi:hypothetical protein